jgi:hypothetical protein
MEDGHGDWIIDRCDRLKSFEKVSQMVRSIFCSIGVFVLLWGISFLMIDKIVWTFKDETQQEPGFRGMFTSVNEERQKVFDPPDWMAFSLLSAGAVTVLYSVALPKKG